MYGIGGLTSHEALAHHLQVVEDLRPTIIFLQLGPNDLCSNHFSVEQIANNIVELCRRFINLGVRRVMIGQVLGRHDAGIPSRVPHFNSRVVRLNIELSFAVRRGRVPVFLWRHHGFWQSRFNLLLDDGVYFNHRGNRRYYRSVRGAILFATTSLRRHPHI